MKLSTNRIDQWLVKGLEGYLAFVEERVKMPGPIDAEVKIAIDRLYKSAMHLEAPGEVAKDEVPDNALAEYTNRLCDLIEYRAAHGALAKDVLNSLSAASLKLGKIVGRMP